MSFSFFGFKKKEKAAEKPEVKSELVTSEIVAKKKPELEITKVEGAPDSVYGYGKSYYYEDVRIYTPESLALDYSFIEEMTLSDLYQDPYNEFDSNAVQVIIPRFYIIGYLRRNRLQDMVNDYLTAGLPIFSYISKVEDKTIFINIAFYGKTIPPYLQPIETYRLIGNKNETMQKWISLAIEGQYIDFKYDDERDAFVALGGLEIGYFPESANSVLESEKITAVISEILVNESDKYEVYVDVYEWTP